MGHRRSVARLLCANRPANVRGVIEIPRRTEIQLALAAIGLVVWGYGVRVDDPRREWIGIAFFAAATALRFFKKRPPEA